MATETVTLGYSQQQASTEILTLLASHGFLPGPYMTSGSITLTFSNGVISTVALVDPVDRGSAWSYKVQSEDVVS